MNVAAVFTSDIYSSKKKHIFIIFVVDFIYLITYNKYKLKKKGINQQND